MAYFCMWSAPPQLGHHGYGRRVSGDDHDIESVERDHERFAKSLTRKKRNRYYYIMKLLISSAGNEFFGFGTPTLFPIGEAMLRSDRTTGQG
nr:hypothetical protein P9270_016050 [Mesorhizobium sp. WSM4875]